MLHLSYKRHNDLVPTISHLVRTTKYLVSTTHDLLFCNKLAAIHFVYCVGAPVVEAICGTSPVDVGTDVTIECEITSILKSVTKVTWEHTDQTGQTQTLTINGEHFSGATIESPSLVIASALRSDSGEYRCCVKTRDGPAIYSETVNLDVQCKFFLTKIQNLK